MATDSTASKSTDERAGPIVGGFRHRGHHHVGRIESLSDAVFGFSITLLVVSLQVPRTFDELLQTLRGFPSFALAFMLLAQIWLVQYRFFRRYALSDYTTIWLTIALLFVIVFFTYPLKFLFAFAAGGASSTIRGDQITALYGIYGLGYASVFLIFALLHVHALRKRTELELTPLEVFFTWRSIGLAAFQIFVAAVSVSVAAYFSSRRDYAAAGIFGGLSYCLVPIGITLIAFAARRIRLRLERELVPAG
jgi:uncharacterized membrane protein